VLLVVQIDWVALPQEETRVGVKFFIIKLFKIKTDYWGYDK
jgi:hypothetical protein